MRKELLVAAVMAGVAMTGSMVQASPTIVALGFQSGSQSGSYGGSRTSEFRPRDPYAEAARRGKSLLSKKVACKTCAHPGGVKDAQTARTVAAQVRAGEFGLDATQQQQVLIYLNSRFGI